MLKQAYDYLRSMATFSFALPICLHSLPSQSIRVIVSKLRTRTSLRRPSSFSRLVYYTQAAMVRHSLNHAEW